jgi:hypothetical protein
LLQVICTKRGVLSPSAIFGAKSDNRVADMQ